MLNLMDVKPGQALRLTDGAVVEVVENMGDGVWIMARYDDGREQLVFCEDISGAAEVKTAK